ncbi:HesB/YadR/YfhF family protein [Bacillus tianshenii]|nr:HesB/YadR/YfhF family protein [Bacillus tianshenii]
MKLEITEEALQWYKEEMDLEKGDHVRFYARYGGSSSIQSGFSLGVSLEKPVEPFVTAEQDGITFFVEDKDAWYFDNYNLYVKYNEAYSEVEFEYLEE